MGNLVSNQNTNQNTNQHYLKNLEERAKHTKFEHKQQYNHEFAKLFSNEGIQKAEPIIPVDDPNIKLNNNNNENNLNENIHKGTSQDSTVSATSTIVDPSLIDNLSELLSETSDTMRRSELNKKYNVSNVVNVVNVVNDSETTVNNTSMFDNVRTEDLSATSYNNRTTTENLETTTTIEHNVEQPVKNDSVINTKNLSIPNNIEDTISETSTVLNNIDNNVSATSPFINNDEYQNKYVNQQGGGDSSSSSSSANGKKKKSTSNLESSVPSADELVDMSSVSNEIASSTVPSMMSEMSAGSYLSSSAHTDGFDSSSENVTTISIGNKNQLSDSINTSDINMISIDE